MMTKKRKLLTIAFSCALGATCALGGALTQKTASADQAPLTMLGASVRLDENQGIRFIAQINGEPIEGANYHVMIVPATWLDDEKHALNTAQNGDYYQHLLDKGLTAIDEPATEEDERDFIDMECVPTEIDVDGDGVSDCTGVRGTISKIKYNNTNRQFFGVAYVEKDGVRTYADQQEKGIRSCTYVAGAALNSGKYADDSVKAGYLDNMINNAYNKVVLGKTETDEQEEAVFTLPEISAYNPLGTEIQFEVNGIEGLDLPEIEWNVEKSADSKSIFNDSKKLVVFDEAGTIKVSTKVAGQNLVANVNSGTCYLETFDNVDNIRRYNQFNATADTGDYTGVYYESITDAAGITEYGVGMGSTKFTGNGNDAIAVRFNKTEEELKALLSAPNFQGITFRMLFRDPDTTGKCTINFFDLIKRTLPENRWANVTITKDDIFGNETLLTEFVDKQGIIDGIAKNFHANGGGYMKGKNGTTNRRFAYVPNLVTEPRELYIDDIQCLFGEDTYLETFSKSAVNISKGDFTATNSTVGTYLNSYIDKDGITEYGIGKVAPDSGGRVCVRFDKTEDELKQILTSEGFQKITFRILVTATGVADGGSIALKFLNTVPKTAIANQWMDIELTKEEILNDDLITYMGSSDEVIDKFVNVNTSTYGFIQAFSSTGIGHLRVGNGAAHRMIHTSVKGVEVYIDHITYTLSNAN